jgi:CBS domain-containing protein
MFLTLALRHLVVVDRHHIPVGVITRKDLLPFKLDAVIQAAEAAAAPLLPPLPDAAEAKQWKHIR